MHGSLGSWVFRSHARSLVLGTIASPTFSTLGTAAKAVGEVVIGDQNGTPNSIGRHARRHRQNSANCVATTCSYGTSPARIPTSRAKRFIPATNSGVIFAS